MCRASSNKAIAPHTQTSNGRSRDMGPPRRKQRSKGGARIQPSSGSAPAARTPAQGIADARERRHSTAAVREGTRDDDANPAARAPVAGLAARRRTGVGVNDERERGHRSRLEVNARHRHEREENADGGKNRRER